LLSAECGTSLGRTSLKNNFDIIGLFSSRTLTLHWKLHFQVMWTQN
jgi:hypothetical protein